MNSQSYQRLAVALGTFWVVVLLASPMVWLRPWPDTILVTDFASYWTGASLVRNGAGPGLFDLDKQRSYELELRHNLATAPDIREDDSFNPFPNLPPLALMYLPLTFLRIDVAYLVWWGISLTAFLLAAALPLRGRRFARSSAAVMLSFGAVTTTLLEGQPYGILLLSLALAILAMRSNRPFVAGLLLGPILLKPQYAILFVIVLLIKGRWREMAGVAAVGVGITALSILMVGIDGMVRYLAMLRNISSVSFADVHPWAMVNWRAVIANCLPSAPAAAASALEVLLGGLTVLTALLVWRGRWDPSSPRFAVQVLVLLAATVVASPHSHIHGAVLLLAPLPFLDLAREGRSTVPKGMVAMLSAGYLVASVTWTLVGLRWLMAPYLVLLVGWLVRHDWLRSHEAVVQAAALSEQPVA